MLRKIGTCQNPKKSYTEKKVEHTPSDYSWVTCCSFDKLKKEWSYYRRKNCMEMFCKDFKNLSMKVLNYEKKEIIPLTNEETAFYEKRIPKEISIVFHNGSVYDYHFIIKKLAIKFKGKFDCFGENTEKYISFSAPIYKKNNNDRTITYKLKFIDSFRFM